MAAAAIRPGQARARVAAVGDDGGRRARHPVGAGRWRVCCSPRWVAMAGVVRHSTDDNPLPGVFYVLMWVGLVAASLAVGPVWRAVSPVRTVYRLLRMVRDLPPVAAIPGALGLLARGVRPVRVRLAGARQPRPGVAWRDQALAVGLHRRHPDRRDRLRRRWFGRADPFEVYSVVASRFSPLRRNPHSGRIEIGNPFDHLPSLPIRPGTVTVLAVLLGSTAFDSFSAMPVWRNFVDRPRATPPSAAS